MCASTPLTSPTRAAGLTPGVTASVFPNSESKRVLRTNTMPKGTLSPFPLIDKSNEEKAPLLTRILHLSELEKNMYEAPRSHLCVQIALKTGTDNESFGSCLARFSKNLPTALTQSEIVTENLSDRTNIQVLFALGRVVGQFTLHCFLICKYPLQGYCPGSTPLSFDRYFTFPFPNLGLQVSITQSLKRTIAGSILPLTMLFNEFSVMAEAVFSPKPTFSWPLDLLL